MSRIVHSVMHSDVNEDSTFEPIMTVSVGKTANAKFVRQGVSFDGFTKSELREAAAILRASQKSRDLANSVGRLYRDYEGNISEALEAAANDM